MVVAEDWIGVDNPKWKGDPVPLRIVSVLADEPYAARQVSNSLSSMLDGERITACRLPSSPGEIKQMRIRASNDVCARC